MDPVTVAAMVAIFISGFAQCGRARAPHHRQSCDESCRRAWNVAARRNPGKLPQCLKKLERVKGIEPSYSAWKAAALPLSYTRARPFNYHAMEAASTAMHRALETACVPGMFRPGRPLNMPRFAAYTEVSINNERR